MGAMATADRRPARERLMRMMQAYKETALLRAGLELGVFDHLAGGPASAAAVARSTGADERGTRILLDALSALGLLDASDGCYRLADGVEAHLVRGRPGFLGDLLPVLASDWERDAMDRLAEAVRNGGTVLDVHAETPGYEYWVDFARGVVPMAEHAAAAVAGLLEPWARGRASVDVLDVACGHGLYGFAVASAHARCRVWSLDWPGVLAVARHHAARLGVSDQTAWIGGDMFTAPLGGPYDLVLLTNVLHHFAERRCVELLRRLGAVTKPGGRIAVVGFALDEPPAADPLPYLFAPLMLAWTHAGEVHPRGAYTRMLASAGWGRPAVHRLPGLPLSVFVSEPTVAPFRTKEEEMATDTMTTLRSILLGLGIPEDDLTEDARLKADLELDSTEAVEVTLELKRRLGVAVKLDSDLSLRDICDLVERAPATSAPAA
jgi:2-polyprenyl-3-methyl-5-hydroxy-6-metoxy-1,4-benzoquinol methylase/acyl carrier protein